MKINVLLTISAFFLSIVLQTALIAQNVQDKSILIADESYGKEIILLPVEWAPGMTIEGFEELRFTPGWDKSESPQFWSYVLSWDVMATDPLSQHELETNLEDYFDGLMKPNHWATEFAEPLVQLMQAAPINGNAYYTGRMKYFDGFHTGKVMSTNIQATQHFCEEKQRTIIIFRISPKPYEHEVWNDLNAIKKRADFCLKQATRAKG